MVYLVIIIKYHNHFWCATLVDVVVSRVLPKGFVRISQEIILYGQRIFKLLLCFWIFLFNRGMKSIWSSHIYLTSHVFWVPLPWRYFDLQKNWIQLSIWDYTIYWTMSSSLDPNTALLLLTPDSWLSASLLFTDYYLAYFWKRLLIMRNNNY